MSVEELDLIVSFLNVGHGDSTVIRFREGHELRTVVVDGGGPKHGNVLLSYLLRNTITKIDLLIASHIDRNHVAGLLPVVESERVTIQNFWGPACESAKPSVPGLTTGDERVYQRLYSRITQRVRPEHILCPTRGMPLPTIFRECTLAVLNPMRQNVLQPPAADAEARKPADVALEQNEHALVLHVDCHSVRLLLTSDITGQALAHLLGDPTLQEYLDVDVLKVPHYGRSHHVGAALTQWMREGRAAVLSVDARDDEHVSGDLLAAFQRLNTQLFCTQHSEQQVFCSNGHCRAARGGQNIVIFCRRGAPFTPSGDACELSLGRSS